ncbi:bifunctional folylpolyglutamate synthase/dihydrofolate synthase [Hyphomicrobium methylovorum]|uniref:bifunctional folylpolyglutamate synthase/dihydrofolate synthase n=1 Tax=Hyphomicrobium methylovorum TaxID=84 RepID=UPI0015E6FA71|nr:folylpolyglutamate synthase/dihydrofolate synthase family protein [Hyphomicrobium methylovorum]MBA2127196.1 bifunctional folylpolyglutamate synthase/dihydrofolate synthase [Hyphomicrobium methylovorum]
MFSRTSKSAEIAEFPSSNILERLKSLHPKSIDMSLDRLHRLLGALGHPERRLPPVVHVAGTNGKGSNIAFMRAIAEAMGKRVHVYTSPHLVDFHERIVLAKGASGAPISEERLMRCLARVEEANDGRLITLFEITTAAALVAFSETPADLLLLETGMGGRLDATNVVDRPLVTAITPISIDHVSYLGDSLTSIAREKAGILKPGVTCVVGRQQKEPLDVIKSRAALLGVPLRIFGQDFDASERNSRLIYQGAQNTFDLPLPALLGRHQYDNAASAIATAEVAFGEDLTIEGLQKGLLGARWPARMERLPIGGLHEFVAPGTEIWLDGGHNAAGAEAIARALPQMMGPEPIHLVWGMIETKDANSVIAPFKGLVDRVFTVPIPGEPSAFPQNTLTEIAKAAGFNATTTSGIQQALMQSQAAFARPGRVLICGSLYLAGHVLKLHRS